MLHMSAYGCRVFVPHSRRVASSSSLFIRSGCRRLRMLLKSLICFVLRVLTVECIFTYQFLVICYLFTGTCLRITFSAIAALLVVQLLARSEALPLKKTRSIADKLDGNAWEKPCGQGTWKETKPGNSDFPVTIVKVSFSKEPLYEAEVTQKSTFLDQFN